MGDSVPQARANRRCAAAINRLETIDSGEILIEGNPHPQEVGPKLAAMRAELGMVFQASTCSPI